MDEAEAQLHKDAFITKPRLVTNARLITYFGNFIFVFLSIRLCDFLYNVFRLQGRMGKTKWKIDKLLRNILVTSSPKTTKNEVTKVGWNAQMSGTNQLQERWNKLLAGKTTIWQSLGGWHTAYAVIMLHSKKLPGLLGKYNGTPKL